jgi:hypothetical protein
LAVGLLAIPLTPDVLAAIGAPAFIVEVIIIGVLVVFLRVVHLVATAGTAAVFPRLIATRLVLRDLLDALEITMIVGVPHFASPKAIVGPG